MQAVFKVKTFCKKTNGYVPLMILPLLLGVFSQLALFTDYRDSSLVTSQGVISIERL